MFGTNETPDRCLRFAPVAPSSTSPTGSPAVRTGVLSALAVIGLPAEAQMAMGELASIDRFEPLGDGTLQADLEVPAGSWRFWPRLRVAVWVGVEPHATPRLAVDARLDLFDVAVAISDSGLALRDLRVLDGSEADEQADARRGWSRSLPARQALAYLAVRPDVGAVRGVWSDGEGRAVRVELHSSGVMFAQEATDVWRVAEAIGRLTRA